MEGGVMMQPGREKKLLRLDPRTKLLMFFVMVVFVMSGGGGELMLAVIPFLCLLPMLLLIFSGEYRKTAVYVLLYAVCYGIQIFLLPNTQGALNSVLLICCFITLRFMPGFMMGYYVVSTTTVSEFSAAMGRMHIPDFITIPLTVTFRFFPTVREEASSIRDSMKIRGLTLGRGKPMAVLEYHLVPLLMCSVKIGEELSAAALTRGLGRPGKRTNICKIGFGWQDRIIWILCVCAGAVLAKERFF